MGKDFVVSYGTPAGGYFGDNFSSGMPEVSIVEGTFLGVKAEFIFNSTRVERDFPKSKKGSWFYEQLSIQSPDGDLFATALYKDEGVVNGANVLSGATDADYVIVAANGCYDALEGDMINITFDNDTLKKRPRTIELKKGKGDSCRDEEKKEEGTSMKVFKWLVDKLLK
jgi:hypothetical protein